MATATGKKKSASTPDAKDGEQGAPAAADATPPITPNTSVPAEAQPGGVAKLPGETPAAEPSPTGETSTADDDTQAVPPVGADPADAPVSGFVVVAKRKSGFWRAGRFWPPEPTPVAAGELSDEQLAAVLAEPLLDVAAIA